MERYAVAAGNWSNTATWDGGTLPEVGDDVYANGFAVTIDQDVTVVSLSTRAGTTAVAGGSFTTSGARTVNADVYAGTTNCLTLAGNSLSILNGNSHGSQTTDTCRGVIVNSTCRQNGNSFGGNGSARSGTILNLGGRQYGDATGGTASLPVGTYVESGGMLIGDSYGGTGVQAYGAQLVAGAIQTGDATGGSANVAVGTVVVTGSLFFGAATGGSVAGAYGVVSIGAGGALAIVTQATGTVSGAFGVLFGNTGSTVVIESEAGDYPKSLHVNTLTDHPAFAVDRFSPDPSDVQAGVQYGTLDEFTGTLVIPATKYPPATIRTLSDTNPIQFAWPSPDVEDIVVERSINGAAYEAADGEATFHRSENEAHWYIFSYNANDRAAGSVRYRLTKDATIRYFTLSVIEAASDVDLTGIATEAKQNTIIGFFDGIDKLVKWLRK